MPTAMRFAWCALPAAILALLVVLLVARPAAALSVSNGPLFGPSTSPPGEEEVEGESEDEELEGEEGEGEGEESAGPPADCLLQTARAKVSVYAAQGRVRLQIRYTSTAPTDATVVYSLSGNKGSLKFAATKQHLAMAGSIRLSENLGKSAMAKAAAAKSFVVELRIPATPHSCRRFDTRHLTIEHSGGRRVTWLQSESASGA
jgi:hypothetical protein